MRFEQALQAMREGKKVKSSTVIFPLFIVDYTNGFGDTHKAICWKDAMDGVHYHSVEHNEIFAEDWEIVEDEQQR